MAESTVSSPVGTIYVLKFAYTFVRQIQLSTQQLFGQNGWTWWAFRTKYHQKKSRGVKLWK